MKLKSKYIGFSLLGILLFVGLTTQFFYNLWGILVYNEYIIPSESSIFIFKTIKINEESGCYWLYAEDKKNYYTTLKKDSIKAYTILPKKQVNQIGYFKKTNYLTWFPEIFCGDLLEKYATKPENLEFVKCEVSSNSQTIVEAEYKVSGEKHEDVENYLVEKYGMDKLIWECCAWSNRGYGQFEHKAFKQVDEYCGAIISMYAEGINHGEGDEFFLDINDVVFTVIVRIIVV